MGVPEPGDQPPALGVDLLDAGRTLQVAAHLTDDAALHQEVDRTGPSGAGAQLDEVRPAQEEVAHGDTLVANRRLAATVTPTHPFRAEGLAL